MTKEELSIYPGGDLVETGLADLDKRSMTREALLVLIAGPRLRFLGFEIEDPPNWPMPYEHALYSLIQNEEPRGAHSAYNALIRRIVSFANSYRR